MCWWAGGLGGLGALGGLGGWVGWVGWVGWLAGWLAGWLVGLLEVDARCPRLRDKITVSGADYFRNKIMRWG